MEVTVVVLFRGALAHYSVAEQEQGKFEARLLKYTGSKLNSPPQEFLFRKEGRHCIGSIEEQDLMDDLCHAVQTKLSKTGGFSGSTQNPKAPYVAI